MRCACIDIGTNTTRLLVAEEGPGGLRVLAQERAFTQLGHLSFLPAAKIGQVTRAVAHHAALARSLEAARIRVVATGVVRTAANREALLEAAREAGGLEVEVLDPAQEATLAFRGALAAMRQGWAGWAEPESKVAVVDVGGGSTELAIGSAAGGVGYTASMAIGSGRLTDAFIDHDPPRREELDRIRARADAAWEELGELPEADVALAVGGSAASLPRLVGERLDEGAVGQALDVLTAASAAEVAERFGLDARRVALLPAGLIVLEAGAVRLRRALEVGRGGLREGVVLGLLDAG
jgi:exopolyphosphatase/guanosine-5'-triphosphate,3'-diphosphate pyrophosphatase